MRPAPRPAPDRTIRASTGTARSPGRNAPPKRNAQPTRSARTGRCPATSTSSRPWRSPTPNASSVRPTRIRRHASAPSRSRDGGSAGPVRRRGCRTCRPGTGGSWPSIRCASRGGPRRTASTSARPAGRWASAPSTTRNRADRACRGMRRRGRSDCTCRRRPHPRTGPCGQPRRRPRRPRRHPASDGSARRNAASSPRRNTRCRSACHPRHKLRSRDRCR